MKAKEIVIKGKVHDVGYRFLLLSEAERLFIEKFDARNVLVDREQHLDVLIEGAEEKISRFVAFAESNYPPEASVESVEVKDYQEEIRSVDSFRQSFMVFQLTKMAQVGVGMLGKQDAMLGKQDAMLGKQDAMIGKQDAMLGKMDAMIGKQDKTIEILESVKGDTSKMLEKQDETITVIKAEGEKTREVVKEKLEEDVEWVKGELIGIKTTLGKVKEKVGVD
jgi:acylphosphatase